MTSRIAPSIVTVYIHNGKRTAQADTDTKEAFDLLKGKGLKPEQIAVVDVEPYPKLAMWLEGQIGSAPKIRKESNYAEEIVPYPLVFIGDKLIGGREELSGAEKSGELTGYLSELLNYVESLEPSTKTDQKPKSWFGFMWGYSTGTEKVPVVKQEEGKANLADFVEIVKPEVAVDTNTDDDVSEETEIEVWRTNWLWRQQKRLLRFSTDSFMRVDPVTRAVRAVFKYDNVDSVVIVSDTSLIIRFTDDTETQHVQTMDAATRERLVVLLVSKSTMHSGHFVHVTDERKQQQPRQQHAF